MRRFCGSSGRRTASTIDSERWGLCQCFLLRLPALLPGFATDCRILTEILDAALRCVELGMLWVALMDCACLDLRSLRGLRSLRSNSDGRQNQIKLGIELELLIIRFWYVS